jgi:hypothetical protein
VDGVLRPLGDKGEDEDQGEKKKRLTDPWPSLRLILNYPNQRRESLPRVGKGLEELALNGKGGEGEGLVPEAEDYQGRPVCCSDSELERDCSYHTNCPPPHTH